SRDAVHQRRHGYRAFGRGCLVFGVRRQSVGTHASSVLCCISKATHARMGTPEACAPTLCRRAPKCSQPSCVKTASENRIANLIVGVDLMKNRRDSLVTKKIVASSLTLASFILTLAFALGSGSFAHPTAANAMAAADALSYLPASDAIALIDVRRLF